MKRLSRRLFLEKTLLTTGALTVGSSGALPVAEKVQGSDRVKAAVESYGAMLTPVIPAGAVVVPAVEGALAKAVGSRGRDTVFNLRAGIHTGNGQMRPKTGSVFVGEKGAIFDGGSTSERCFTHDTGVIPYSESSPRYVVTLRNLVIRNHCSADQQCAVMAPDTSLGWSRALSDTADRSGWLIDGGEYDHNGGFGLWFDYVWDGNVVKNASFSHNRRPGLSIEMAGDVDVAGCTFSGDDIDGLNAEIPSAFRPWDKSPKSGSGLWSGEIMLFNGCAAGTYVDPATKIFYSFSSRTWIHDSTIVDGEALKPASDLVRQPFLD